jgi:preprotein translocase subunit SecD
MVVYYKASGFVADSALILNLILIGATMSLFGATLTLPGIAGIALTVGMAVDANVLINERIREELRLGKSPMSAVEAGYDKAFSAILDSNLTTIIAAVALYAFGTGPIKGFAVTLTIGLLASMFTAITGTRVVLDWVLSKGNVKRLSI